MAEKKVSELTEASNVGDNDLLLIVQEGVSKKVKKSNGGFGVTYSAGDYIDIDNSNKISLSIETTHSTSSTNDICKNTSTAFDFWGKKKGKYKIENYSTNSSFYYKFKTTDSGSYTNKSISPSSVSGSFMSSWATAEIEVIQPANTWDSLTTLPIILAVVTLYENKSSDGDRYVYTITKTSQTTGGYNIWYMTPTPSTINSIKTTASNASSTAGNASYSASQALSRCDSLDTRVTALEQGGGSGGEDLHILKPFGNCSSFYIPSSSVGYNTFTGISGNPDVTMNIDMSGNTIVFAPTSSAISDFTIKNAMLEVTNTRTHEVTKINLGNIYVSYYNPVSISANVLSGLSRYDSYNATLNEGTATGLVASKVLQFDLYDFTSYMGTFTLNRDSDSDFWTTMDNLFKSVTSLDYTGLLNITSSIYDTTTPTVTIMQGILCGVETSMNYVALRFASYYYNQSSHQPTLMSYTVALNWNSTNNRVGNITINM